MDQLDLMIVRSLLTDTHNYSFRSEVRESVSSQARKLGVSEPTLRSRVKGYAKSGFLRGWSLFFNPSVTGHRAAQVSLDVLPPSSKHDAVRKIRLIDGVFYTTRYHGNRVGACLIYDDEDSLRKHLELMARIANAEHVGHGQLMFPPCTYFPTSSDLAIIKAIQERPNLTYSLVARATHFSTKTVKRRLNRMISEGAVFVAPKMDFRQVKGSIPADVYVYYTDPKWARDTQENALKTVERFLVYSTPGSPEFVYALVFLENVEQANEILDSLKALSGVKEAYVDLIEEHAEQYTTLTKNIGRLEAESRKAEVVTRRL